MLKKIEDMNYYELLEVSPRATAQEVHKAYERVRKIYDPNSIALYSLFSPEETEKIRQRIEEAYRTLLYEENRREYDRMLQAMPSYLPEPEPPMPMPRYQPPRPMPPLSPAPRREEQPASVPPAAAPASQAPPAPAPAQEPVQMAPAAITEFTGSVLKVLREQRNLSLQNIADQTKVSARHLEHIEEENFQKLPARPYLRGFLTLFAKAIGYEPDKLVSDYMKRYDAAMYQPKK